MNIESTEKGSIGIMHLKRFWQKSMETKAKGISAVNTEFDIDNSLLSTLRIGLEPTLRYLYNESPSFDGFEKWIMDTAGQYITLEKIEMFNEALLNRENVKPYTPPEKYPLTEAELDFWNENGYLIIPDAVSKQHCSETLDVICDFLDIKLDDPDTWYQSHHAKQGIMVQLFNHEILERNRFSPKIQSVFQQLWKRNDLLVNADRVSFNPPERPGHPFQGPDLHWDVSLQTPIPFGLQGLLYLSDTAENQGAFTLVPGFHNRVETWLSELDPQLDPREQDLHALGSKPLAAKAGDFIIWHQALPHGSRPNTASLPRIVQYINHLPMEREVRDKWI